MKLNSVFTAAILLLSAFGFAGVTEHTYYFNAGETKTLKADGYDIVSLKNTLNTAKAGEPSIPYHSVSLLLPPGEKAENIEILPSDEIMLEGQFNIYPQQHSQPISKAKSGIFAKNEQIYKTNAVYPESKSGVLSTHYLNGHSFALSTFTPVEYNPVTGELAVYQKVTVRITTSSDTKSQNALQNLKQPANVLKKIKDLDQNSGSNLNLYSSAKPIEDPYDYLIITSGTFNRNFDTLINFYKGRGIDTKIVSTTAIYGLMTGADNEEKIRNYIIQEYQNSGIEFVLLAGDIEIVPAKGLFCEVQSSSVYTDDGIPADVYYSALDGNWNTDGDAFWGEIGEDDLLPELSVARFTFSNLAELNILINKTIKYQSDPVLGELRDPLIAGEWLYDDPESWGSDYLELLIGYHEDNGYTTTGIPEDNDFTKMYDENGTWDTDDIIAEINNGHSFIHHDGHANYTYTMKMDDYDVTNANFSEINGTTHNYTLVYTSGCMCGGFDYDDCIAEKFVSIENFAVSFVGNSRYGWFNEGQTEGPSIHIQREFTDALYGSRTAKIGTAHKESKIDTAPWVNAPGQWEEGALRWCFYDCNVLGDPAMNIWTDEPEVITVNYSNVITIGQTDYELDIKGSYNQPLSKITCSLLQSGVIIGSGETDDLGNASLTVDPSIVTGEASLVISGLNVLQRLYAVNVISNEGKYIVIDSYTVSSGGDDIIEFGETASVSVTLKNVGLTDAAGISMAFAENDDYIFLTDSLQTIGNLIAGTTASFVNAFTFTVSQTVPDLHQFSLNSTITDSFEEWKSSLNMTANSPIIEIQSVDIADSVNSVLDPGETADMAVSFKNTGHGKAVNLNGLLTSDDPHITVNAAEQSIAVINPDETLTMTYNVTAGAKASAGYVAEFINQITADNGYLFEDNFFVKIGSQIEDFETGDFTAFNWYFEGNTDWTIDTVNQYEGTNCARSGEVGDSQTSVLVIDDTVLIDGDISFYVKTSTEGYFDPLIFSIDGVEIERWNYGILDWHFNSYPVSSGDHTFKWSFEKDEMESAGEDCVWIDYITFPGIKDATGINEETENLPSQAKLYQNYPNPFNPSTEIAYSLSAKGNVSLSVYNMKGELVKTLVDEQKERGLHKAVFASENINSGVYFYKLSVNGTAAAVKRMLLIK
jgi:hypothetical protein